MQFSVKQLHLHPPHREGVAVWFFAFDKLLHFCAGLLVCLLVGVPATPIVGLVVGTGVGIAKEMVWDDLMDRGTPEFLDALATCIGSYVGMWWLTLFLGR